MRSLFQFVSDHTLDHLTVAKHSVVKLRPIESISKCSWRVLEVTVLSLDCLKVIPQNWYGFENKLFCLILDTAVKLTVLFTDAKTVRKFWGYQFKKNYSCVLNFILYFH